MDEMEEGEISDNEDCTTDAIDAPYKPLARPNFGIARPLSTNNDFEELEETGGSHLGKSLDEIDDETPASRILLGYKDSSSGSDSDDSGSQPTRKLKKLRNKSDNNPSNGGEAFQKMATEYQRSRGGANSASSFPQKKKANNIWGNLLNEEILTADMSDIAVGRSAKEFRGDRGAESYNYLQAQRDPMTSKIETNNAFRQELDKELNVYWSRRSSPEDFTSNGSKVGHESRRDNAIIAGKKRSIKERLGRVKRSLSRETEHNNLDDLSIPPPGVPRTITDVPADILNHLNVEGDSMESEAIDASNSAYTLGEELAAKLSEPKIELIVGVVELVGVKIALNLFAKTQAIEKDGGMMIKNGQRRRTPGGVFLHLLRELATSNTEPSIDPNKVKKFFAASEASSQRRQRQPKPKMSYKDKNHGGSFQAELAEFQRLSKKQKQTKNSNPGTSKSNASNPLPDLIAFHDNRPHKDEFENALPEAPPNSVEPVERALSTYDDDFLSAEVDDFIEFDPLA